ncbi:SigE family RNA polymerase sigma factor [Phytohabitans houttuyneae]|uniref:RNA polymerase sigma24 factor n=1 Tax=Phytohabitans houttuyneae TaxID=1076126 RepID=A0A6V8KHE8_9ACTN|nr:SigE family RNA polymerase sigma factor [Phytohabitans houttuyneae]GFJ81828.1 RNA polymerase sigma24 factor [Phytohabitans houttuyneae]
MTDRRDQDYVAYVGPRLERLRRVAYLLCHDWHRADDLVQVTVTRLYVHWRRVQGADDIDRYVHRILINAFLSERRKASSRETPVRQLPDTAAPQVDEATTFAVRAALARVPARQRATIVLRFYCDLTVEQAAEVLSCSAGTVKSQTAKGLTRLREVWHGQRVPAPRLASGTPRAAHED